MSKLLIYIGENQKFDLQSTVENITSIDGTSSVRLGKFIGAVLECNYSYGGRTSVIRLSEDLETVSVEGLGEEAMDFAVKFQQRSAVPLRAIDMEYSFDLELSKFSTGAEFMSAIRD